MAALHWCHKKTEKRFTQNRLYRLGKRQTTHYFFDNMLTSKTYCFSDIELRWFALDKGIPPPLKPSSNICLIKGLWQGIQYFDQNWVYASDKSSFIHKLVSQTIRTILINGWASRSPKAVPSVRILYTSYFLLLLLLIKTHFFLHLCLQENMVTLIRALEVEIHQSTVSADGF